MAYLGKSLPLIEEEKRLKHKYGFRMSRADIRKEGIYKQYAAIEKFMSGYDRFEKLEPNGQIKILWRTEDVAKQITRYLVKGD